MANAIFYHKEDSVYDDIPSQKYHFPKSYKTRVEETVGDLIAYYGPLENMAGRYYWATARVEQVLQDSEKSDHFYAILNDYLDFDSPLHYSNTGGYEAKLIGQDGKVNGGYAVQAVRLINPNEFQKIIENGLSKPDEWPERTEIIENPSDNIVDGFFEPQREFFVERPVVRSISSKKFRSQKFRQQVRSAYDRTCAFTGLKLINGGGRPEVEAAHIIPVEKNGSDSVQNGIALSGTVHWMFDRGLLSMDDNYTILKSRHINHDISHLLVADLKARVPKNPKYRPHPFYLNWHRENCFKS